MKLIRSLVCLALLVGFVFRYPAPIRIHCTLTIDGKEGGTVTAGKPADLCFAFNRRDTGARVKEFEIEHGKLLHLVVVSEDLQSFAHIHPVLDPSTGEFRIRINAPIEDPDSQDAPHAMSRAGGYLLFTEILPKGMDGIRNHRFLVTSEGASPAPSRPVLEAPEPLPLRRYFHPDGTRGVEGAPYRASLTHRRDGAPGVATLTFSVEVFQRSSPPGTVPVTYTPVENLELWLTMTGHAILLSESGALPFEKQFRHMHPFDPSDPRSAGSMSGGSAGSTSAWSSASLSTLPMGSRSPEAEAPAPSNTGPEIRFVLPETEIPPPGRYKIWSQFKHRGRILTFPFAVTI